MVRSEWVLSDVSDGWVMGEWWLGDELVMGVWWVSKVCEPWVVIVESNQNYSLRRHFFMTPYLHEKTTKDVTAIAFRVTEEKKH